MPIIQYGLDKRDSPTLRGRARGHRPYKGGQDSSQIPPS